MRVPTLNFLLGLSILATASLSSAAVWKTENQWSDQWERAYSDWMKNDFTAEYYVTGPFGRVLTDCADAVYGERLIFSYLNKLPFRATDAASGQAITNETSEFDSVPESARFKRFMIYVFNETNTKSLVQDTYPVAITPETIRPGTVWLRASRTEEFSLERIFGLKREEVGHAEVVKDVAPTGVINLMSSTVPASVRPLKEMTEFYILPDQHANTGFRRWKTPDQFEQDVTKLPGYSLEQYHMGAPPEESDDDGSVSTSSGGSRNLGDWTKQVTARLATTVERKDEYRARIAKDFCTISRERIAIVTQGNLVREKANGVCLTPAQAEAFSTPSRDAVIHDTARTLLGTVAKFGSSLEGNLKRVTPFLQACGTLAYRDGVEIDFVEFMRRVMQGKVSSDPNQPIEVRWGEAEATRNDCKF